MSDPANRQPWRFGRRQVRYWVMNWDFWFLWLGVLLVALAVGGLLGAVDDTIRHIRIGY